MEFRKKSIMIKVLFVCLGNICRSPAAEGIFRHLVNQEGMSEEVIVASCGIGDWHLGQLPDPRIRSAASNRGISLTSKAKPFITNFIEEYDYILAADNEILEFLHQHAKTPEQKAKLHLMTAFSKIHKGGIIPDPYYQGSAAFDHILDILEDSCKGLLQHIKKLN